MLAQQSPFFNRLFLSRSNIKDADIFFPTIKQSVIQTAIDVIYGKKSKVDDTDLKRVVAFLNLIEVEYLVTRTDEKLSEEQKQDRETTTHTTRPPPSKKLQTAEGSTVILSHIEEERMERMESEEDERDTLKTDFTVTTASDTKVQSIDHSWIQLPGRNRNQYSCNHCNQYCISITQAESHYIQMHYDGNSILQLLVDKEKKREVCLGKG